MKSNPFPRIKASKLERDTRWGDRPDRSAVKALELRDNSSTDQTWGNLKPVQF